MRRARRAGPVTAPHACSSASILTPHCVGCATRARTEVSPDDDPQEDEDQPHGWVLGRHTTKVHEQGGGGRVLQRERERKRESHTMLLIDDPFLLITGGRATKVCGGGLQHTTVLVQQLAHGGSRGCTGTSHSRRVARDHGPCQLTGHVQVEWHCHRLCVHIFGAVLNGDTRRGARHEGTGRRQWGSTGKAVATGTCAWSRSAAPPRAVENRGCALVPENRGGAGSASLLGSPESPPRRTPTATPSTHAHAHVRTYTHATHTPHTHATHTPHTHATHAAAHTPHTRHTHTPHTHATHAAAQRNNSPPGSSAVTQRPPP